MLTHKYVSEEQEAKEQELAARLNSEDVSPDDVEVVAAEHPEGRKRGGVVAAYEYGGAYAFYDETACEWVPYNN